MDGGEGTGCGVGRVTVLGEGVKPRVTGVAELASSAVDVETDLPDMVVVTVVALVGEDVWVVSVAGQGCGMKGDVFRVGGCG